MAKKKKSGMDLMFAPVEYKPPTKAEIIRSEAKHLGQRIADADPKVKKVRDEISRAVEAAVKSALKGK
jgi:hypothetical protein